VQGRQWRTLECRFMTQRTSWLRMDLIRSTWEIVGQLLISPKMGKWSFYREMKASCEVQSCLKLARSVRFHPAFSASSHSPLHRSQRHTFTLPHSLHLSALFQKAIFRVLPARPTSLRSEIALGKALRRDMSSRSSMNGELWTDALSIGPSWSTP